MDIFVFKQTIRKMKQIFLSITVVSFMAFGLQSCKDGNKEAETETMDSAAELPNITADFSVDTEASVIEWEGYKPLKTHNGTIDIASGSVLVNNGEIEQAKFAIDMNSIEVLDLEGKGKENLQNHLIGTAEGKETDFFNATEYPFSTFLLNKVFEKDGNTMMGGDLTIKDITHYVEFPATVTLEDNDLEIASEPFKLDRTKWGLNFKSKSVFDNLGDNFVSDDMQIKVKLVAKRS